jgi:hypothetical protein
VTFTYLGDLSTDLDKIRFEIGDDTENDGPLPSGGNFTDEELGALITREGSWQAAAVAALRACANRWSRYADLQVGPRKESYSQIAASFRAQVEDAQSRLLGLQAGVLTLEIREEADT